MDYAEAARRHRAKAEQARVKAELTGDENARAQYLKLAEAYDELANNAERMSKPSDLDKPAQ